MREAPAFRFRLSEDADVDLTRINVVRRPQKHASPAPGWDEGVGAGGGGGGGAQPVCREPQTIAKDKKKPFDGNGVVAAGFNALKLSLASRPHM